MGTPAVFPSTVAADFYKYLALREHAPVQRDDHYCSWDSIQTTNKQVSFHERHVFAAHFLKTEPFALHDNRFYELNNDHLRVSIMQSLPYLACIHQQSIQRMIQKRVAQHIATLYAAYTDFLTCMQMQESLWSSASIPDAATLFLPELYSDQRWMHSPVPKIHISDRPEPHSLRYFSFTDARSEIDHTFSCIDRLMHTQAVASEDIVITVAQASLYKDDILAAAHYYNIPISYHVGEQLSSCPGSRLFWHLEQCRQDHFSVESLRELFLDPSLYWQHPEASDNNAHDVYQRILRLGRTYGHIKGVVSTRAHVWNRLKYVDQAAFTLFTELTASATRLYDAHTFAELKEAAQSFIATWMHHSNKSYVMNIVLKELHILSVREENYLAVIDTLPINPWQHFIAWLTQCTYTPNTRNNGVAVYPYGVSAGISPQYHFVMNCSLQDTQRTRTYASWLNAPTREQLQLNPPDQTEVYAQAYCRSGYNIICSYALSCFDTQQLPQHHITVPVQAGVISHTNRRTVEQASYNVDLSANAVCMDTLSPLQHSALMHHYHSGLNPILPQYRHQCIEDTDLRAELARRVRNFSPKLIDSFSLCPFSFLMSHLLGLSTEERHDNQVRKAIGIAYHSVLHELFGEMLGKEIVIPTIDQIKKKLQAYGKQSPLYLYVHDMEVQQEKMALCIMHCLEALHNHFPHTTVHATEQAYTYPTDFGTIMGTIDLILTRNDDNSYIIIDYKTTTVPTKKELYGETRTTIQLPLYAFLASQTEPAGVSGAYYYALEKGKLVCVCDAMQRSLLSTDEFSDLQSQVVGLAREIHARITAGDYRCEYQCAYCRMPALSRSQYASEL